MLTVQEYLENIVEVLNSNLDKKYVIKCFDYPIQYGYTEEKAVFVEEFVQKENVIAITASGFNVRNMFQGFLTYPEEYPDFYSEGNFILCYGPSDSMDCDKVMNSEVPNLDSYTEFYGLENFTDLFQQNEKVLSRKHLQ